jgi:hypothetical protein
VEIAERVSTHDTAPAKKTFALKPDTKKNGVLLPGAPATVYYRKRDNVATEVDVVDAIKGLLVPGDEPDPPRPPICSVPSPTDLKAYLGSSLGWTRSDEVTVLEIKSTEVLGLLRTSNGMAIRAEVFSEDGAFVAQIIDNRFYINPANFFRMERPDTHTLIVYDKQQREMLNIRYLNPYSVRVLGIFQVPGSSPVIVTQDELRIGGAIFRRGCASNSRVLWAFN